MSALVASLVAGDPHGLLDGTGARPLNGPAWHFTAAVACARRMERRYRRTYAGRPGYPKREDWLTERK
ncbi:MAG: hypothetical protein ACRDKL_03565, partial [Solirubrobacteraceae bacterium]